MRAFSLLPLTFLLFISVNSQGQQKQYFDENWEKTKKSNASYYRLTSEEDGLFIIEDHYMDGTLQFSAVSSTPEEPFFFEGTTKWYYENGQLKESVRQIKNTLHGVSTTYYSNGEKKSHLDYIYGAVEGPGYRFFPWGGVALETNFKEGQFHGSYTTRNFLNEIQEQYTFKNGQLNGPYEIYNSNGSLSSKGSALNGRQNGQCFVYHDDGRLRREYHVVNGLLEGHLYELSPKGDTVMNGRFENGIPLRFEAVSMGTVNNSKFSVRLQVENGQEHWTGFRDGVRYLDYYYKDGYKTGEWKIYAYNSDELYEVRNYDNSECHEPHGQSVGERFSPFFLLSSRFDVDGRVLKDRDCEDYESEEFYLENESMGSENHPIYAYREEPSEEEAPASSPIEIAGIEMEEDENVESGYIVRTKGKLTEEIDYKDPAKSKNFIQKNNCEPDFDPSYPGVTRCSRAFGDIIYHVYTSDEKQHLLAHKVSVEVKDNEVHFYYQSFEEKTHPVDHDIPDRYMAWKLSEAFMEGVAEELIDGISLMGVVESRIFNVDEFSGMSAFSALERELMK